MLPHPKRLWLAAMPPLALGLVLRCWFVAHAPRLAGDTLVYGGIARNWLLHGVYGWVLAVGHPLPTLIRLPGYPLFLTVCFKLFGIENYRAVLYLQATIDLAACLLLAGLAARLFGGPACLATLWLAALCPFTASYAAAPLTETLTLATLAAAFYCLHRWYAAGTPFNRWLWPLAATLAYSILLRPEQGLLALAILAAVAWQHPGRPMAVVSATLLTLLPLVPWTLRNARTFHVFEPLAPRQAIDPGETAPIGFERWYRTWAIDYASTETVYWNYDGTPIDIANLPHRAFDTPAQRAATAALLDDYNQNTNPTPELDARFAALAAERTAAHPWRTRAGLPLARLLDMVLRPRTELFSTALDWWRYREHHAQTVFAFAYAALNLAYFVLAAWGAVLWHRSRRHLPLLWTMLATVALRAALLLTLDNAEPRYTLEFFPVLFLLAALPLAHARAMNLID